jgi:hypothetical protein
MKIIACLTVIAFIVTGCTTLRPISQSQNEIQKPISYKEIIRSGDKVRITTTDGKQYKFKVTSVTDDYINGKDIEILTTEIKAIEKRQFSMGKTTLLVAGIAYLLYEIGLILSAPAAILSGG